MKLRAIGTYFLVTVIALIVWALAESQTLQTGDLDAEIVLDAGSSARVLRVRPEERWDGSAIVDLSGPAGAIDRVRAAARDGLRLRVGVELPAAEGDVTFDLADALQSHEALRGNGVNVVRVQPSTVQARVEPLVQRVMPVTVQLDAGEAERPPTPTPAEVTVFAPASWAERLGPSVTATVPAASVAALRPGEPAEVPGVPVGFPDLPPTAWGIRIEPPVVNALVVVRNRTSETTIDRVPVQFVLPSEAIGRWRVEVNPEDRNLQNLRVRGPAASITRVANGQVRVRALVELSAEALTAAVATRPVELVGLPSGVGPVDELPTVRLTITPVAAPGGE